jgi:hypothetical protein
MSKSVPYFPYDLKVVILIGTEKAKAVSHLNPSAERAEGPIYTEDAVNYLCIRDKGFFEN